MRVLRLIFLLFTFLSTYVSNAQCVMCRATMESEGKGNEQLIDGINSGILYLMGFPYVMLAIIGYLWYRSSKKKKKAQKEKGKVDDSSKKTEEEKSNNSKDKEVD